MTMRCAPAELQLVILSSTAVSVPTGESWSSPTQLGVTVSAA
jgi:hypothetical protein